MEDQLELLKKQNNWHSLHIYYEKEVTNVLLVVKELIKNYKSYILIWFFIRYFDEGNHIRLRISFKTNTNEKIITNFYLKVSKLVKRQNTNIIKIKNTKYVPEILRYGGVGLINLAETHFMYSSHLFVQKFKALNTHAKLENLIVFNYMILVSFGLNLSETCKLNYRMYLYWKPSFKLYFPEVKSPSKYFRSKIYADIDNWILFFKSPISNTSRFGTAYQYWLKANKSISKKYYKTVSKRDLLNSPQYKSILPSLIHMNNNRFGLNNYEEAYILYHTYYVIKKVLKLTK